MITNLYLEYLSHRNNQSQVQSLTQAPQTSVDIANPKCIWSIIISEFFKIIFIWRRFVVIRDLEVDLTQNNQLQQGYRQGKNFYSCQDFLNNALLHIDRTSKNSSTVNNQYHFQNL